MRKFTCEIEDHCSDSYCPVRDVVPAEFAESCETYRDDEDAVRNLYIQMLSDGYHAFDAT